nr:bifunctional metallophosphatase/5'-nucleotidase [Sphaerochaetaceae bacterium]
MKKRLIAFTLLLVLFGSAMLFAQAQLETPIVILYTNDVHCGYNKNINIASVADYKKQMLEVTPYVTLIDNGDAIQGETVGTVSTGEYLVDMMNAAGYDLAIFGNHEFDYGMDRLAELIDKADYEYLNATITYSGKNTNLLADTKPYKLVNYGLTTVAFIGVSTHETLVKSTPKYFMEDGEFVYNFATGEELYAVTQSYIDEVRALGADYVIVMSHLGLEEESAPDRATDLIANTKGIDVLLDGHSHSVVESSYVQDAAGRKVLYSQTGTKLENLGMLTIYPYREITAEFVHPEAQDPETAAVVAAIESQYLDLVNTPVAVSDIELNIKNPETGARAVRNRETAIGDLCADAYRYMSGAQIAFVNGGGIRATIAAGDITLDGIIKVHPYGNMLCMCEATGQEILDALEWASRSTLAQADDGAGKALGELGGFLQVSGLKYTIDTSVASTCIEDENGFFAGVAGDRRVKDVMVGSEEEGWTPIVPEAKYTLACHNYLLQDMGDGFTMFTDNMYLLDNVMLDNQVLINYIIDGLEGKITAEDYGQVKGRITV